MKYRGLYYGIWAALGLMLVFVVPFWVQDSWIDEVTGSSRSTLKILYLVPVSKDRTTTAVERWIIQHKGVCANRWKQYSGLDKNVYGQVLSRACSLSPPSRYLNQIEDDFLEEISVEAMEEFLEVMRTGTRDQQQDAVMDLIDWQDNLRHVRQYSPRDLDPEKARPRTRRVLGRQGSTAASAPVERPAAGHSPGSSKDPKGRNVPRSPSGRDSRPTPRPRHSESIRRGGEEEVSGA